MLFTCPIKLQQPSDHINGVTNGGRHHSSAGSTQHIERNGVHWAILHQDIVGWHSYADEGHDADAAKGHAFVHSFKAIYFDDLFGLGGNWDSFFVLRDCDESSDDV